MKKTPLYSAHAALASGALYFAQSLSRGDRGTVDWVVIGLFAAAVLYNLVRLGQRLFAAGGKQGTWHLVRTLLFWTIGLLNTAFARPEDVGGWRTWVGGLLLVVAVVDSIALARKEWTIARGGPSSEGSLD